MRHGEPARRPGGPLVRRARTCPAPRSRRPLTRFLLAASLVALAAPALRAQPAAELTGRVTDADGAPLPGANVYLSGTTRGTATDADGRFRLALELGAHRVVASLLGHETAHRDIRLVVPSDAEPLAFVLPEATLALGAVRVEARANPAHLRRVRRFREAVLGTTANARATTVENAHVLAFADRRDALGADADAPLELTNHALGYRLFFDLTTFEADGGRARYAGEERFEPLAPADAAEAARWRAARARAYRGSLRHLLQALAAGRALADGFAFTVHPDGTDARGRPYPPRPAHPTEIFRPAAFPRGWFELRTDGRLEVVYTGERAPADAAEARQVSGLRARGGRALVDARGALAPDASLTASGRFATERLADLVPLGYRPPERGGTE